MSLPVLGDIAAFAGHFEPRGWKYCDGRTIPIKGNEQLFQAIGTKYGGDGKTTLGLPKMKDPAEGVRYVVVTQGRLPPPPDLANPYEPDIIGFLVEWNGSQPPRGTEPANGRTLEIAENVTLYTVLDNTFGGSQDAGTFALPKLGGKWIIATDGQFPAGG